MLYVSTDITRFIEFKKIFRENNPDITFLDLSTVSSSDLASESKSIVSHHKSCAVFLGYLEPGWMLENSHQTILRSLIRKFPTAMICNFIESISFSWKNEIDSIYVNDSLKRNGSPSSLNNGCSV
jgi:hypothetical protein